MLNKEINEKINAQKEYLRENKIPQFAPPDGICYWCHQQIYEKITLEKASSKSITGCPFCLYSFVG